MKKAIVFDPYLDTLGGGEVYVSTVASCLLSNDFQVDLIWNNASILAKINKYLGIDINYAKINNYAFWLFKKKGNILEKRKLLKQYNLAFFLSDGSIPWLFSEKNILHFQVPFKLKKKKHLIESIKKKNLDAVVCNSKFTKSIIDKTYGFSSHVLYPPLNIDISNQIIRKKNIILSVGRFTKTLHNKRQDILIKAFKDLIDSGLKGWSLVLAGSTRENQSKEMIEGYKKKAEGYPIIFRNNISHSSLVKEYLRAKLFWHASGYGVDQEIYPERVEHFGLVTAEAMASGCVPLVLAKGGQTEIVRDEKNGFLWLEPAELKRKTMKLINNPKKIAEISMKAKNIQSKFSKKRFCREFSQLISF